MKTSLQKNIKYSEKFVQPLIDQKMPFFVKDLIKKYNPSSILDMGCGDGIFINAVKKEFPNISITGIDISPRRINGLKKRFPRDNFFIEDVCDTKLKQQFDFVHSSQVIEHVENDKEMTREMERLLKNEGLLFCSSYIQ